MATGEIEVLASSLTIINRADVLPLDSNHVNTEEARLKYRYLDLRRPEMAQRLKTRAKITSLVRRFMDDHGFLDIETPMLTKATPEGARDYLVPSRVHKGKFYALPQSPQLFKQLLMMSVLTVTIRSLNASVTKTCALIVSLNLLRSMWKLLS